MLVTYCVPISLFITVSWYAASKETENSQIYHYDSPWFETNRKEDRGKTRKRGQCLLTVSEAVTGPSEKLTKLQSPRSTSMNVFLRSNPECSNSYSSKSS